MKPSDVIFSLFERPKIPAKKDLSAENTYSGEYDLSLIFPASNTLSKEVLNFR